MGARHCSTGPYHHPVSMRQGQGTVDYAELVSQLGTCGLRHEMGTAVGWKRGTLWISAGFLGGAPGIIWDSVWGSLGFGPGIPPVIC